MGIDIHRQPFFYLPVLKFIFAQAHHIGPGIRSRCSPYPGPHHHNNMWLQRAVRRPFILTAHGLYEGVERVPRSPLRPLGSLVSTNSCGVSKR